MIGVISLYELLTRYGINLNNIPSIISNGMNILINAAITINGPNGI